MFEKKIIKLPLLPLKDIVLFPNMNIPVLVGRLKSVKAIEYAVGGAIFITTQKDFTKEDINEEDIYKTGVFAKISQSIVLPDKTVKVLIECDSIGKIESFENKEGGWFVNVKHIKRSEKVSAHDKQLKALVKTLNSTFEKLLKIQNKFSVNLMQMFEQKSSNLFELAYFVASHINLKIEDKYKILECVEPAKVIETAIWALESEIEIFNIERKLKMRIKSQVEENQSN